MTLEETIEFFGFIPEQLLQDIEDDGIAHLQNDKLALERFLTNFTIFKEYVTRHCFNFPENFSYERKITDKRLDVHLQKVIDECTQIRDETSFLIGEKKRIEYENILNEYKIKRYLKLVEDMKEVKKLKDSELEMNKRIEKLNELFGKVCGGGIDPNGSGIGMLLENEEFRRELENKEINDLMETYDVGFIDKLIESHKKE